ncbi:MAG: prenyltransferase/squalene oxidase repeat-containing protein [Rhodothermales bacterium]
MKRIRNIVVLLGMALATTAFIGLPLFHAGTNAYVDGSASEARDDPKPLPPFVEKGLAWLAEAQLENGGWGAGTHTRQDIRDPHAVQTDPATTAFSAMALIRSGSTLTDGPYKTNVRNALTYLLNLVETYPKESVKISDITGTQPQVKLGQHIDVSMAAQFFTQMLPHTEHDQALRDRVANALETCVTKLSRAQDADGSWNSRGGWAGVLQSAMANNALEMAEDMGVEVDREVLDRSRQYQKDNVDEVSGAVRTESAAGVSLYALSSNQRATAKEAREAQDSVAQGARDGLLTAPTVSEENLQSMGYSDEDAKRLAESYRKNKAASDMLRNDEVLSGFGNNGGEEYLSYMMTSESLVVADDKEWDAWYQKMHRRLAKIQNADGSWSGHHCITSPVFCTAAVILTMTADRAAEVLAANG